MHANTLGWWQSNIRLLFREWNNFNENIDFIRGHCESTDTLTLLAYLCRYIRRWQMCEIEDKATKDLSNLVWAEFNWGSLTVITWEYHEENAILKAIATLIAILRCTKISIWVSIRGLLYVYVCMWSSENINLRFVKVSGVHVLLQTETEWTQSCCVHIPELLHQGNVCVLYYKCI